MRAVRQKVLSVRRAPDSQSMTGLPLALLACGHEVILSAWDQRHLDELKDIGKNCPKCGAGE